MSNCLFYLKIHFNHLSQGKKNLYKLNFKCITNVSLNSVDGVLKQIYQYLGQIHYKITCHKTHDKLLPWAVVMVYRVVMNTELVSTEPLLLRKYRVRFLWASGHKIFINWSIYNLVLCVFQFWFTLLHVYCWFVNMEFIANNTITHLNKPCLKHIFPP